MYDISIYDEPQVQVEVEPVEESTLTTINELLIQQLQHEKTNYYTYLNFSGICDCKGLTGASKFFRKQSEDENNHFNWIFDYCCDRIGFIPELRSINALVFDSNIVLTDMIQKSFELEIGTTNKLVMIKKLSLDESDYLTSTFLDKLILEQREEEKSFTDILNRCRMFGDTPVGIMMIDQELGE